VSVNYKGRFLQFSVSIVNKKSDLRLECGLPHRFAGELFGHTHHSNETRGNSSLKRRLPIDEK
jgi:hypothetical protein